MALTVAFEFLFFHYVAGIPGPTCWRPTMSHTGNCGADLLWVVVAPYIFYRLAIKRS